jgi:hypothetical protein
LIAALAVGTVAGFGHGIASLGHCAAERHAERRAAFEDHVAEVCTRAAERVIEDRRDRDDRDRDRDDRGERAALDVPAGSTASE